MFYTHKFWVFALLFIVVIGACKNTSNNTESNTTGSNIVEGCTDPNASNYNPNATDDDGSCTYPSPANLRIKTIDIFEGSLYGYTREYVRLEISIENTGDLTSNSKYYTPCIQYTVCGSGLTQPKQTYNFQRLNIPSIDGHDDYTFQTAWEKIGSLPVYPCLMIPSCTSI